MKTKKIDGAVVLDFDKKRPWETRPFIATKPREIISAAGSKYTISSTNQILSKTEKFKGKLAFVGIPPQVQSIRKLQQAKDPSIKNIKYVLGPFYGNSLHFSSVISLLKTYGVDDYHQIKSLRFREGDWPGYTQIILKSGQIIKINKFYANYLIPFHINKRSLLCTDFTNEFTDISGGDAWAPKYEQRHQGFSLIISRSSQGEKILQDMKKKNIIELKEISIKEALEMHSHAYDLKKRGAFIRIKALKLLGKQTPNYGYEAKNFPLQRYLMEIIIDTIFLIGSTNLIRRIVEKINPQIMGKMFLSFRSVWKKITKNTKKVS